MTGVQTCALPIPGFTGISMYPKLWEAEGISAAELIDDLLMLAVDEME